MENSLFPWNKVPGFELAEAVYQDLDVDGIAGKELAHLLHDHGNRMLTIGEATEQCGGVIEAEALVQVSGVQHRASVSQGFQAYARPEGEGGRGAGALFPAGHAFGIAFTRGHGSVLPSLQLGGVGS